MTPAFNYLFLSTQVELPPGLQAEVAALRDRQEEQRQRLAAQGLRVRGKGVGHVPLKSNIWGTLYRSPRTESLLAFLSACCCVGLRLCLLPCRPTPRGLTTS